MPAVGAPTDEEQHKHNAEHPQPDARLLAPGRRCRWRRGAPVLAVPVELVARFPFGSGYHPGANGFPMPLCQAWYRYPLCVRRTFVAVQLICYAA
jgi:hypothetical protein